MRTEKAEFHGMDPEEFRAILSRSRSGIWALIEAAISVAGSDYGDELRRRRDKIVQLLYAPEAQVCRSCNGDVRREVFEHEPYFPETISNNNLNTSENIDISKYDEDDDENKKFDKVSNNSRNPTEDFCKSPLTPESNKRNFSGGEEEDDVDPFDSLFDDEQAKILSIKEQLEDLNQSEETAVELLQCLADMDITFQALKETDIGRHVNRLRKHSSNQVRTLVKQLVRKWKETVDEWVTVDHPQTTPDLIDGSSSVERKYAEHGTKPKPPQAASRREAPSRPPQSVPNSTSALPNRAPQRETALDEAKLDSARKRLQENYQEAQNAKKQRKIQVMDIHDIPKSKNAFFSKNKGNFQGRQHR